MRGPRPTQNHKIAVHTTTTPTTTIRYSWMRWTVCAHHQPQATLLRCLCVCAPRLNFQAQFLSHTHLAKISPALHPIRAAAPPGHSFIFPAADTMAAFISLFLRSMACKDAETFEKELPHHAREVGEKSCRKNFKYDFIPQLKKADAWFASMRLLAARPEHPWWPTLQAELESGKAATTACVVNLACLLIRWKLPVTPFLHALCRMAAEHTRTDVLPPADSPESDADDEAAEDHDFRFADMKPEHMLDVSYWSTLGKLPGRLLEQLVKGDPGFKLWQSQSIRSRAKRVVGRSAADRAERAKKRAKVRADMYRRPPMEQMQADGDWMEAVKYAADAQVKLGRAEVLEGLKQAALIRSVDRTRAMTRFYKNEAAAQERCREDSGLITLTPKMITQWSNKKAVALKEGEKEVAALEEPVRQLFAAVLEERKAAAREPPVFTLPGDILPAAPKFELQEPTSMDPLPCAKRARRGEPTPGPAVAVAASIPVSLTDRVITPAAAAAAARPIMIHAPVSIRVEPAANVSVSVHIAPGRALPTSLVEVTAATSEQRLRWDRLENESRKRKREAAPKQKRLRYCEYNRAEITDWEPSESDEPGSDDEY